MDRKDPLAGMALTGIPGRDRTADLPRMKKPRRYGRGFCFGSGVDQVLRTFTALGPRSVC